MASWELYLDDPLGNRIQLMDTALSWTFSKVVNTMGSFSVKMPDTFDYRILRKDQRIEFWRGYTGGGALQHVFHGFVRGWTRVTDAQARNTTEIFGHCPIGLLKRRVVAYRRFVTPGSSILDHADDVLKHLVYYNCAAGTASSLYNTTGRDWTANGFTVQADSHQLPSQGWNLPWRNVLLACQTVANSIQDAGYRLYFDVVSPTPSTLQFRTYPNQRGADRSHPSGANPIILSVEGGDLANVVGIDDWTDEWTRQFGGKKGMDSGKKVWTADSTRMFDTPWNIIEHYDDTNERQDIHNQISTEDLLGLSKPIRSFRASIIDTGRVKFGRDWEFGDRLTVDYRGESGNVWMNAIEVSMDDKGMERVQGRLEVG